MVVVSQQQPAANPIPSAKLGMMPKTRTSSSGASGQNNATSATRATPKLPTRANSVYDKSWGRPRAPSVAGTPGRAPNISGPTVLSTGSETTSTHCEYELFARGKWSECE
ncbi:hypothetical protein OG21DRAFT_1492070 [Imleria badia]|nr:hypothetical protein OG21DRAFT_1492070 [Imleria badia]